MERNCGTDSNLECNSKTRYLGSVVLCAAQSEGRGVRLGVLNSII